MKDKFSIKDLNNMIHGYQDFRCNGVEITSRIHASGPEMCHQLIVNMARVEIMESLLRKTLECLPAVPQEPAPRGKKKSKSPPGVSATANALGLRLKIIAFINQLDREKSTEAPSRRPQVDPRPDDILKTDGMNPRTVTVISRQPMFANGTEDDWIHYKIDEMPTYMPLLKPIDEWRRWTEKFTPFHVSDE